MEVASFSNAEKAFFVDRPNRFIVIARLENGIEVSCHCPNPGRLIELTLPGQELLVQKSSNPDRKHAYTLVGAIYKDKILPLYSVKANDIAEQLILPTIFKGEYRVRREVSIPLVHTKNGEATEGNTKKEIRSRFDLAVNYNNEEHYIEVKACTLSEYGVSAFPDAPSERAARHLRELEEIKNSHVILILFHQDAEYFIPNLHTDPAFAETFFRACSKVHIHCASVSTDINGDTKLIHPDIPIIRGAEKYLQMNQGSYLIEFTIPEPGVTFDCAELGELQLEPGCYIYTGYADEKLSQVIHRHFLKRKTIESHIDLLFSQKALVNSKKKGHPVYGKPCACTIACALSSIADNVIAGFDAVNCSCTGHLFYFKQNPFKNRAFLDVLFKFRYQYLRPEFSE